MSDNARYLTPASVPEPVGALVCDASFIGLATLLPAPLALCAPEAWAIALIKPQFEAGPGRVGSKGGRARSGGSGRLRAHRGMVGGAARLARARSDGKPDHRPGGQSRVPDRRDARPFLESRLAVA